MNTPKTALERLDMRTSKTTRLGLLGRATLERLWLLTAWTAAEPKRRRVARTLGRFARFGCRRGFEDTFLVYVAWTDGHGNSRSSLHLASHRQEERPWL